MFNSDNTRFRFGDTSTGIVRAVVNDTGLNALPNQVAKTVREIRFLIVNGEQRDDSHLDLAIVSDPAIVGLTRAPFGSISDGPFGSG
jgi:hypothetical protein